MPHFNIIKQNKPANTFRVSKVCADFDVKFEHSNEHFEGDIELPQKWNIGVIVGKSGTGKTTIAKELFGNKYVQKYEYKNNKI
jgi:ABC-type glutathione transport system ATPase component